MIKHLLNTSAFVAVLAVTLSFAMPDQKPAGAKPDAARGKYLVTAMGCADCHTPKLLGPNGPVPDESRNFSGHPESMVLPPAPKLPEGPWMVTVAGTLTAWAGPWGTSFPANLTPDEETGLGRWTEKDFIATIRSGRHMGRGRQILPPMPYEAMATFTDEDLGSIFAYLQSLPAVKNRVPDPLPPAETR